MHAITSTSWSEARAVTSAPLRAAKSATSTTQPSGRHGTLIRMSRRRTIQAANYEPLSLRLVDERATLLMSSLHLDYVRRDIALDHGSDRFSTFLDYSCV